MKGLLKFITCGSVDDGKSTLIGHILYDSKLLYTDQEEALVLDSKVGSREGKIDYSLLLDGLMAEREQGITIDVAYRYFTTSHRSFIVADTPGHEEYTRNMAVGASFAQLSILLVDAKQGVLLQTRRHARICKLMGIRHFVFAVNKMDLVGYKKERFDEITKTIEELANELKLEHIAIIPVSATEGDNVTSKSEHTPWYEGKYLLEYLEQVEIEEEKKSEVFYLPVQRVCRPNHEFRGFSGQIEEGEVRIGEEILTLPSRQVAKVKKILIGDKEVIKAIAGQPVTIQLDREVDVSRGCVLTTTNEIPVANQLSTTLLWMDDEPLKVGKSYQIKIGTRKTVAIISSISYTIDVNTGEHQNAASLWKNEIASCELELSEKITVDEFSRHKTLGELILIDPVSHMTSACGVVERIKDENANAYFEDNAIKASGYIFEEFYFNLENAYLTRKKGAEKTYHVGDEVPVKGDSFAYPDFFDVIHIKDQVAVSIREKKITAILPLDEYVFTGLPILDEKGFKLFIKESQDLEQYKKEYKELSQEEKIQFHNKWAKFEGYRFVVCNDNFWMI